jgi:hypothetical protein
MFKKKAQFFFKAKEKDKKEFILYHFKEPIFLFIPCSLLFF